MESMDVEITGRHTEVTDDIRNYVWQHIEKLPRHDDKIQYVTVTLDENSGTQMVEIIAKCHRADLVAEAKGHDMYRSIDEAFGKMERQIKRYHDKLVDHRSKGLH